MKIGIAGHRPGLFSYPVRLSCELRCIYIYIYIYFFFLVVSVTTVYTEVAYTYVRDIGCGTAGVGHVEGWQGAVETLSVLQCSCTYLYHFWRYSYVLSTVFVPHSRSAVLIGSRILLRRGEKLRALHGSRPDPRVGSWFCFESYGSGRVGSGRVTLTRPDTTRGVLT